jgi:hypothetical protein
VQIIGVQSVGARSLGSVSTTVADTTEYSPKAGAGALDRDRSSAARTTHPEAVVFPRDGKPLDQRPVQLRQQRADERYREDGRPRERRGSG